MTDEKQPIESPSGLELYPNHRQQHALARKWAWQCSELWSWLASLSFTASMRAASSNRLRNAE